MKNLTLKRIRDLKAYRPPIDGRYGYDGLLLDFNERTTGSSRRLYPEYFDLTKKIARYAGVDSGQVMVTNGTDQAIDVIVRTFSDRGDQIVIPEPTFAMYGQYARINGNVIVSPLYGKDKLDFPLQDVLKTIDRSTKLVVVCNPNNPTGTLVSLDDIARIARKAKRAIVYVDEAYYEFSGVTATGLINEYPNIIVSRTFSKAFGMAGLRIGYVIARPEYVAEMLKVRGPYDVNQPACSAASDALEKVESTRRYSREVMEQAKPLVERFLREQGIPFYPSAGNFILFKPENPRTVAESLRENGIALRPQDKRNVEGTLRVTIGTPSQMKRFIDTYRKVVPRRYAFIDRDGTLIDEPQDDFQVDSPEKLKILDGAVEGLKRLQGSGYRLVMVSNQNGIGTPSFPQADFDKPQNSMLKMFKRAGVTFEKIFICPHLPEAGCGCRKPKTGLVDDWLKTLPLDRENSFVCGDRETDKKFAGNLGLKFLPMTTNGNFLQAIDKEISR